MDKKENKGLDNFFHNTPITYIKSLSSAGTLVLYNVEQEEFLVIDTANGRLILREQQE